MAASVAGAALISTQRGPLQPEPLTTTQESSLRARPPLHAGLNSKNTQMARRLLHPPCFSSACPQHSPGVEALSPHMAATSLTRRCGKPAAGLLEGTGRGWDRDRARREGPPAPPRPASPQERRGAAEGPCARAAPPRSRAPDTAGPVGGARGSGRSRARFYLAQGPGGGAGAGSAAEPADGRGRSRRGNAAGSSRRPRRR